MGLARAIKDLVVEIAPLRVLTPPATTMVAAATAFSGMERVRATPTMSGPRLAVIISATAPTTAYVLVKRQLAFVLETSLVTTASAACLVITVMHAPWFVTMASLLARGANVIVDGVVPTAPFLAQLQEDCPATGRVRVNRQAPARVIVIGSASRVTAPIQSARITVHISFAVRSPVPANALHIGRELIAVNAKQGITGHHAVCLATATTTGLVTLFRGHACATPMPFAGTGLVFPATLA